MRFLAIHFDGYGGDGTAFAAFEIEAAAPDAVPSAVFPSAGGSAADFANACDQLRVTPSASAIAVAKLSAGQHVGFLARKDTGMVVAGGPDGLLPADQQFHWHEFNSRRHEEGDSPLSSRTGPALISISEVVARYGVARKTVMRWLEAGKIAPAFTLPGRTGAHLFTIDDAEAAFAGWNGGAQPTDVVGAAADEVLTSDPATESPAAFERDEPRLALPHWYPTSYGVDRAHCDQWNNCDWSGVLAALEGWLSIDVNEALAQPAGAMSPRRVTRAVAVWDPCDLRTTEKRLRDIVALREAGRIGGGHIRWDCIGSVDALIARAVFEQGRNEDSLAALNGPLEMGCPYWLLQIRFIAEGRLAKMIGAPSLAFESFWRSLDVPLNGLADVDYLLRSLYELATLESSWLSGVPEQAEWARLALSFGEKLQDHRGVWFDATIEDELRVIMRGTAT